MTDTRPPTIIDKISTLPPKKQHMMAIALVSRIDDAGLAKLSYDDRLFLIGAFVRKGDGSYRKRITKKGRNGLARLYKATPMPQDFQQLSRDYMDYAIAQMASQTNLKKLKKDWAQLSEAKRIDHLRNLANFIGMATDTKPPIISLYNDDGSDKFIDKGEYVWDEGKIRINTSSYAVFDNFREMLDLVVHESSHHLQYMLVEAYNSGNLPKTHPTYKAAQLFAANTSESGEFFHDKDGVEAYKNQPIERHAWKAGHDAAMWLNPFYAEKYKRLKSIKGSEKRPRPLLPFRILKPDNNGLGF